MSLEKKVPWLFENEAIKNSGSSGRPDFLQNQSKTSQSENWLWMLNDRLGEVGPNIVFDHDGQY